MVKFPKKIAILGFGREGKAILRFLKKNSIYKNAEISILDQKFNKNYLNHLQQFDLIFRSPGVPYNLPRIQQTFRKGTKFSSATQLFFENARGTIIGITGTKGKGTVSTLLYKILKASGKRVFLAGNIGKPAIELLPRLTKNSIVVLELSSFQLHDLRCSPHIAVVLDVFADHLDVHKNFGDYINTKANIVKYQSPKEKAFYFHDNKYSRGIALQSPARKIAISPFSNSRELENIKRYIKIPGKHNIRNVLMAARVAKHLDVPDYLIIKAIQNFRGLPHRLQLVRAIRNQSMLVKFYNDSASTNPWATIAAIRSFKEPKILIAGGKNKNLDYTPLAKAIKNSDTKSVILFGENKNKIKSAINRNKNKELRIKLVKNLQSAVKLAYNFARSFMIHASRFIILFSPGSASFDMFNDYQDRGRKFEKIVMQLK